MSDPYNLNRFVTAQADAFSQVLEELRAGFKRGHWIWFVFPQIKGLGRSATSEFYGISSLAEAQAYACHPVLGPRLEQCAQLMLASEGRSAEQILGNPDDWKFRSSMTLFLRAAPEKAVFQQALDKYFEGRPDPRTLMLLD